MKLESAIMTPRCSRLRPQWSWLRPLFDAAKGLSVLVLEAKDTIGEACALQVDLALAFKHDICSAIHPLAHAASPF